MKNYEHNFLFEDKATKQQFVVTERTEQEARFVAEAYYMQPEYKRIVSTEELKSTVLALCRRY